MRKDYDEIKQKFNQFISIWMGKRTELLSQVVISDVHAYVSVSQNKDSAMHSIYGIQQFISEAPCSQTVKYEVGNYICRFQGHEAQQIAQVSCIMEDTHKAKFLFIAQFANHWLKEHDTWKMKEIRIDIQPFESERMEEFKEVWYFEEPLANLTPTVHLPCIFPEMDSPYYQFPESMDVLTEQEKIEECFYKFLYGIDWIMFIYVKETLSDQFKNDDKHHFIAYQKFIRQRYRYHSSAFVVTSIKIDGNQAFASAKRIVPNEEVIQIHFVKEQGSYKIIEFVKGEEKDGKN